MHTVNVMEEHSYSKETERQSQSYLQRTLEDFMATPEEVGVVLQKTNKPKYICPR
ncbi:hypothetical protein CI610_02737 [invertebrate metagenome]|uniref:Uncharacterized protein n=1 Tax=invertebrate metagenome TaxID=1711999 RepID=A0A2H9T543_9ZZZZ